MNKTEFNTISSWNDLKNERKRLEVILENRNQQFGRSMHNIKQDGSTFLINKVMVPLGAMGLGSMLFKVFTANGHKKKTTNGNGDAQFVQAAQHSGKSDSQGWLDMKKIERLAEVLKALTPVFITAFNAFQSREHEEEATASNDSEVEES